MLPIGPTNIELADALDQMAEVLLRRGEPNPYRVQAYLQAAALVRDLDEPVARLYGEGGVAALRALPGIGAALGRHLADYIETGRIGLRDRLLRAEDPVALLATLPGVSPRLAQRLVDDLGIRSFAELERAAHDGRLLSLDGIGPRTVEAIRLQLNSILSRASRRRARRIRRQVVQLAARPYAAPDPADRAPEADVAPLATIYSLFPPAAA